MLMKTQELTGKPIKAVDEQFGCFDDILLDDHEWLTRYVVISVRRWLPGGEKILVSPSAIDPYELNRNLNQVPIKLSRDRVEQGPRLQQNPPISKKYKDLSLKRLGYGMHRMSETLWDNLLAKVSRTASQTSQKQSLGEQASNIEKSHLRSCNELRGYTVLANGDYVGRVVDFVLYKGEWSVEYIIVETNSYASKSRELLIRTNHIDSISWENKILSLNMTENEAQRKPTFKELGKNTRH